MAKVKSTFVCQNCGAHSAQWLGQCPSCKEWNSYTEEISASNSNKRRSRPSSTISKPIVLSEINTEEQHRVSTNDNELDRVLGSGIVAGSVMLIGGEPGIGKSTLMLQIALKYSGKVLYVSGEESHEQIKSRADRIAKTSNDLLLFCEGDIDQILSAIEKTDPDLVIIDSVQTLRSMEIESTPGSVVQTRFCTSRLIEIARQTSTPIFLIGHINKDGMIAGPKVLEHMVDVVLQFEGSRDHLFRLIRPLKNRFGSMNELGIYEMQHDGLKEVNDPSRILVNGRSKAFSGVAVSAAVEGTRPMLIEVQALVSSAVYGTPQRSTTGFDIKRLNMLLAVLEKRCGFRLAAKDVFINLTGGIRVNEPGSDLAVVAAVLSSNEDIPIDAGTCLTGEVGLTGEIRPVARLQQRINEAAKLGFERIIVPKGEESIDRSNIDVQEVSGIQEAFSLLFG